MSSETAESPQADAVPRATQDAPSASSHVASEDAPSASSRSAAQDALSIPSHAIREDVPPLGNQEDLVPPPQVSAQGMDTTDDAGPDDGQRSRRGRRRRTKPSLMDAKGEMAMLQIPGHENQRPREVSLDEIRAVVGDCRLCPLGETRTKLVFGVGNPQARVMFVGEGPGRNEDLQGEPFVGAAGQKLNGLLGLAGLRREDIYIANVIKCRPPGNRNPRPEEIEACSPFLREQIRSIWPDVIVCLGNFATQFVLRTEQGVTKLRGQLYQTGHFVVMPTFHPAATIYHSDWLPLLESDMRMLGAWLAANPPQQA